MAAPATGERFPRGDAGADKKSHAVLTGHPIYPSTVFAGARRETF